MLPHLKQVACERRASAAAAAAVAAAPTVACVQLVEIVAGGLADEQQKVRTITALAIAGACCIVRAVARR